MATAADYRALYQSYIAAIQPSATHSVDLSSLSTLVHPNVIHNSRSLGVQGYKSLIQTNIVNSGTTIHIDKLLVDIEERTVTARLIFSVPTTCEELVGYRLKKRDGVFEIVEHVIYRYDADQDDEARMKIGEVWSVVDESTLRENAVP